MKFRLLTLGMGLVALSCLGGCNWSKGEPVQAEGDSGASFPFEASFGDTATPPSVKPKIGDTRPGERLGFLNGVPVLRPREDLHIVIAQLVESVALGIL